MLLDLLQSQGSQRIVTICISAANIARPASDDSGTMLQESVIAFQQLRQSTIILQAINALQRCCRPKTNLKSPLSTNQCNPNDCNQSSTDHH
jgi:hypothetical protein